MAVIKQGRTSSTLGPGAVLDLRHIDRAAREVLERARVEAEALRAGAALEAQQDAETRRLEAWREGFERGRAEGREAGLREGREAAHAEAKAELDRVAAEWTTALDLFRARRDELIDSLARAAVRLGTEIGRRVVHAAPRGDPDLAAVQAARALEVLGAPSEAVIVVHPEDRAAVERHFAPLAHRMASGEVRLVEDASVGRGGCIARAAGGEVDASVDPMIDRVVRTLLGPLPEGSAI
ncbi:MAG: hypothetical protein KF724_09665 [Phycisphaeraceae bacterium]|nr:hypothetical protein [Phycisphaeraceae bacterium]